MDFFETLNFLENIDKHTEQEIISNIPYIKDFFHDTDLQLVKVYFKKISKIIDKNKILNELFKNEKKFLACNKKLDFPENLKFGVEIEVSELPLEVIQCIFESNTINEIMKMLEVPNDISNAITQNFNFEGKNEFNKWIFSKEVHINTEASSPIMQNNVYDLNQIVAICTLLSALNAKTSETSGLHINIGVDYLECNEKSIENLLKIWGECEELFFKMANPEREILRNIAHCMATPIKENIQKFFEEDGSVTLNTEEDMEKFLYQIQARNRLDKIVTCTRFDPEGEWGHKLYYAKTDEERFKIYHEYNELLKKKKSKNSRIKFTSINFNHMKWNSDNPGRIEIRIFNSSLEPKIIFQDLMLVGKIFDVSLKNAKDSTYKKDEFEKIFLHNVTEIDKVNNLLNLLFDEDEQKRIFKKRWSSINKEKEYRRYISGKDTFER